MTSVPRILIGVVAGYVYLAMKKKGIATSVSVGTAAVCALTNTILFPRQRWLFSSSRSRLQVCWRRLSESTPRGNRRGGSHLDCMYPAHEVDEEKGYPENSQQV